MAHLQYMPGDPRLVDQLVYELKSKGIFDQFRKDCIADVDTRPAYQNLRQRVESSVSTFLSRQCWQPDLNKNQLREKLRKHILDGNYLEQGVERIVDQVVNPKVASVFIPQVEDLVYNYLGITRKKTAAETSCEKPVDLLPTDLEAVSPGSVKSNSDDKNDSTEMDTSVPEDSKMEVDPGEIPKPEPKAENCIAPENIVEVTDLDIKMPDANKNETQDFIELDCNIPMPAEDIKVENIPPPQGSPPKIDLEKNNKELIVSTDIPLPDEIPKDAKENFFKPIVSDEDDSSSDSSLRRNMSPLTPIRNFMNENSCDAQQAFENDSDGKGNEKKEPSTFRFAIEAKSPENSPESIKADKKDGDKEQTNLTYRFNNQININNFNTPLYEDSSNSHNLQIDYESDANSKAILEAKVPEDLNLEDTKKDRKAEEKKSSHKSSHRSRDSSRHSSSKDKRTESKPSSSRDSSRHDKKYSRDESKSKSSHKDKSSDKSDRKDSDKKDKDSKHRSSSHRSSSHKDSKSHKSSNSSSSQRHSSKNSDEKKSSSSSHKDKSDRNSERSSEKSSKDRSKDSKSSSHRSDKDRKSSSSSSKSSKNDDKDKDKKSKKETDDHYSLSGRGNSTRRSTDRDSNDGSSSSKGSHNPTSSKSSGSQIRDSKSTSSKSDNTSPSGESTSPSDKDNIVLENNTTVKDGSQSKPVVRIDTHLENPIASPPRLPFVPDVTLKKPKFAANLEEAKKLMKMRRFLDEEQKRMNQEAALLLEFQANVRPSLSQVYSSIPGPELEFACVINNDQPQVLQNNPVICDTPVEHDKAIRIPSPTTALLAVVNAQNIEEITGDDAELTTITKSDTKESIKSYDETTQDAEPITKTTEDDAVDITNAAEPNVPDVGHEIEDIKEAVVCKDNVSIADDNSEAEEESMKKQSLNSMEVLEKLQRENETKRTEYFEVIVIAEELSESEESQSNIIEFKEEANPKIDNPTETIDKVIEKEFKSPSPDNNNTVTEKTCCSPIEEQFRYFDEQEKHNAELEKDQFAKFFKAYVDKNTSNKVYLINCDPYEESVLKEALQTFGEYEIVNYHRNGHLELPKASKNIVKNVNLAVEVSLPFDNNEFETAVNELEMDLKATRPAVLSPVKSECSFDLSNDYDAKLDEMVNKTSRQEIMEIILGNAMSQESPSKMPKIDYFTESNIDDQEENSLKRKLEDVETVNNNRPVLTPKKMRKMSTSDQISSTTEEDDDRPISRLQNNTRSKYLGRARRVGLPKPRRADQPNSPSSDKSVENYEQNTTVEPTPNGKIKTPQRNKIQRYDTSELYKPKLHYLSRRNNIS